MKQWSAKNSISWFSKYYRVLAVLLLGCTLVIALPTTSIKAASYPHPVFPDNILPTFTYKQFNVVQPNSPHVRIVDVVGQSFNQALEATTPADFPLPAGDSGPYSVTTQALTTQTMAKDDVVQLSVWLRSVGGPGVTTLVFERNGGDYAKSLLRTIYLSTEWKQYTYLFRSVGDFAAGEAQMGFWLGYHLPQTVALGGATVQNLGPDAEIPPPSYDGRDPNAPWRAEAAERIEQHRKANLNVTVRDQSGQVIPNATVHASMTNHEFSFGSATRGDLIADHTDPNNQIYREKIVEMFNTAVPENDFKWDVFWEDINYRETKALPALNWLHENGLRTRGHNLIWMAPWVTPPPDVVELAQTNPAALRNRIDNHIKNELSILRGKMTDWDLINEIASGQPWVDVLGGKDEIVHWFKLAKEIDPKAEFALNDEPFFFGDGVPHTFRLQFYEDLIKYLKEKGAPIASLGVESHFSPESLAEPEDVMTVLNRIASFGVTPMVTEYDLSTPDEQLQADYLRDYLTTVFSHPATDTFMMWGFRDGSVWLPNTGLYRADWSEKPAAAVWKDLIYKQWWTDITGTTDNKGKYTTRGFRGDYKVEVTVNGVTNTLFTKLSKDGKNLVVKFDPNAAPPPPVAEKPLPPPPVVPAPFIPDRGSKLLTNGNVENGTGNWFCFGGCSISVNPDVVHAGNSSLLVSGRTEFWQGPAQNLTSRIRNNTTYQSSTWVRLPAGSDPARLSATIKVQTSESPDPYYFPAGSEIITADGWTELKASIPLSVSGTITLAEWWASSDWDVPAFDFYIDDAQISAPSAPATIVAQNVTEVNGKIEGSLQQLTASNITFQPNASITQALYVPGTPATHGHTRTVYPNELPSDGDSNPTDKVINLLEDSHTSFLISRTNPGTLPTVVVPATPTGTREVVINQPGQSIGDAGTLKNLFLNSGGGEVAVPPGTYGYFGVNAGTTLTLGVADSTTPTVYNLQALNLNARATLKVVGPVILNVGSRVYINGTAGSQEQPLWLTMNVSGGDVVVNSNGRFNGVLNVPAGHVTINSKGVLYGRMAVNSFFINTGGVVKDAALNP